MNDNDNLEPDANYMNEVEIYLDCEDFDIYTQHNSESFFGLKALILFVICLIPLEIISIAYLVFKAT